ncbi:MAG: hypothetical protein IPM39_09805 [Chloroflexi bacterium]|nr:hypothetical protein [Chloroflexota bacterium]
MSINFGNLFKQALKDERKVLRPYFFPAASDAAVPLVTEESYLRLRLARMFLKNRRELFKTHYPVVNAQMHFPGLDGEVEVNFVVQPDLPGQGEGAELVDVVTMNQTLLGPVLYRGGDLKLLLGLYAVPGEDWAQRFIKVAEGVSQLAMSAPLATAVSLANVIKTSVENSFASDSLDLRLGLDSELRAGDWLQTGYLVMIAAPDEQLNPGALRITDGELRDADGNIYTAHDYLVLAIEVTSQRSDWQALGYGTLWQKLLKTAADADDIQAVKESYTTFSGAILASADLSWSDRSAIATLAQQRIKAIRDARSAADFFAGMKGMDALLKIEALMTQEPVLPDEGVVGKTAIELLQTDWLT